LPTLSNITFVVFQASETYNRLCSKSVSSGLVIWKSVFATLVYNYSLEYGTTRLERQTLRRVVTDARKATNVISDNVGKLLLEI